MKNSYQLDETMVLTGNTFAKERGSLRKRILTPGFCTIAAAIGVFGGIAFLFVGLICVVLHEIMAGDFVYNKVGTTLLISAIPMILVGSIFLDEIRGNND